MTETIRDIFEALKGVPGYWKVYVCEYDEYEDYDLHPISTEYSSYRGDYSAVAIELDNPFSDTLSVTGLRKFLRSMIGEKIYGYKGGEFDVTKDTDVYFVEPGGGNSELGFAVKKIEVDEDERRVIIFIDGNYLYY